MFLEALSGEEAIILRETEIQRKMGTLSLPAVNGGGETKMGLER